MVSSRSLPGKVAQQLSLLAPGRQAFATIHRLFFALSPDEDTRRAIARVAEGLRQSGSIRGQWLDSARYHMTLHFLGDHEELRPDLIARATAAAAKVATPGFELTLDRLSGFRGRKPPGVLRCPQDPVPVQGLWDDLRRELALAGFGGVLETSFIPHVTLFYSEGLVPEHEPIVPIRWPVRQFVLVHSLIGKKDHRVLGEWRLPG